MVSVLTSTITPHRCPASTAAIVLGLVILMFAKAGPAEATPIKREGHGCKALADAQKLRGLETSGRQDTYKETLGKLYRWGECRTWSVGEEISTEDESNGLICLAAKGSRNVCYWSSSDLLD